MTGNVFENYRLKLVPIFWGRQMLRRSNMLLVRPFYSTAMPKIGRFAKFPKAALFLNSDESSTYLKFVLSQRG
ncbi:MAG: hypothetical protein CMP14_01135 [Rickettsiales bacterium]|nr:hypothetical protein [Rickettsiales bacterium]